MTVWNLHCDIVFKKHNNALAEASTTPQQPANASAIKCHKKGVYKGSGQSLCVQLAVFCGSDAVFVFEYLDEVAH